MFWNYLCSKTDISLCQSNDNKLSNSCLYLKNKSIKKMFLAVYFIVIISMLSAAFSITESPGGHIYDPVYTQVESFSIVPVEADHVTVLNSLQNPTINAEVIKNNGTIHFTIEDIALFEHFVVSIDGSVIHDYSTDGLDISFSRDLMSGRHQIDGAYSLVDPSMSGGGYIRAFDFEFVVTCDNHYYENNYAKLYPCNNGVSEYGAIRPALFVEGFRLPGIMDGGEAYIQSLVSKWKASMSDRKIYMLVLNNPTDDVRNNAMVVLGTLRFIHDIQTVALVEGTSVYGYSMGGVLARYALAYAEQWGVPHYCTQYISLDAPQMLSLIHI